jgi:hypothetical protein
MKRLMDKQQLARQNREHAGTGGRSQENAGLGFAHAFYDYSTCTIHLSRFANGQPAPFHVLDGLPDEAVRMRTPDGRVIAGKSTLISGFVRGGYFYTRTAAARLLRDWDRKCEAD